MKQKTILTIGAAALGLALLSKCKSISGVREPKIISRYNTYWIEIYSPNGVISKSDAYKIIGRKFDGRERSRKYLYVPVGSREEVERLLSRLQRLPLEKNYEVRIFTDAQFGMRSADNGYAVPFTKKQQNEVFFI